MPDRTRQVEAITHGTVIDHLPPENTLKAATVLGVSGDQIFIGVNLQSQGDRGKGVIKIAGRELNQASLSQLALMAPEATVNIIRDYKVIKKGTVSVPDSFHNIAACPNSNCITNHQTWATQLDVIAHKPLRVRCYHCERSFEADQLALL